MDRHSADPTTCCIVIRTLRDSAGWKLVAVKKTGQREQKRKIKIEIKVPDGISNEDLDPIALAYCMEGGEIDDLPAVIGISERCGENCVEWLRVNTAPRFPDPRYLILIPETSLTSCISCRRALNLRLPEEGTGDQHLETSFFDYPEPAYTPLAGRDGLVNTVPTLGSRGVGDMGRLIADQGIKAYDGPVWVANHYGSIADIDMHGLLGPSPQEVLPACQVDDWLRWEEVFKVLVANYIKPPRGPVAGKLGRIVDAWLPTVSYVETYD